MNYAKLLNTNSFLLSLDGTECRPRTLIYYSATMSPFAVLSLHSLSLAYFCEFNSSTRRSRRSRLRRFTYALNWWLPRRHLQLIRYKLYHWQRIDVKNIHHTADSLYYCNKLMGNAYIYIVDCVLFALKALRRLYKLQIPCEVCTNIIIRII